MTSDVNILKGRVDRLLTSLNDSLTEFNASEVSSLLDELDCLNIDRELLQTTRIGSSLTKLAKSLDRLSKECSNRVLSVIEKWKNQLRSANQNSTSTSQPTKRLKISHNSNTTQPHQLGDSVQPNTNSVNQLTDTVKPSEQVNLVESSVNSNTVNSVDVVDGVKGDLVGDEFDLPLYSGNLRNDLTRDKALRYLFRCFLLGQDFGPELGRLNELVFELESALYEHYVAEKGSQKGYNLQLKCIAFNLKDIKNTFFNYKLYTGAISVPELVTMSSLQMASDEKKLERSEILEQSLEACQSDWAIKNIFLSKKSSGQFKCQKCNSKQTTYYQLQTRSSDEPMTTFVTCLNCKNRWRF